ncbi:helix-turn-helix transcriptional regulator [Pseudonocardia asaccharolytica]|uniref:helix-turn-helix transcriptional regulator n=2 Tax=Pseudonocardia asaccharolytica TaxID=54010 RepID=UPI001378B333|nr:helix-turn-helix domain-containing protein [Pseudonocardia asaccharolytica]
MGTNAVADRHRTHGALAGISRVRLLEALRAGDRPLDARELAAVSGLHISTVRFHLEILSDAGLVKRHRERTRRRGRPRLLYVPASAGGETGSPPRGYEFLAAVLARYWGGSAEERARRAEQAGRAVAREQGLAPPPSGHPTVAESAATVSGLFAELGFDPEPAAAEGEWQIRLHACPFRAVAVEHPEVACSLHLGLLQGALAELGTPAAASSLAPFVEPQVCVARIRSEETDPPPARQRATTASGRSSG